MTLNLTFVSGNKGKVKEVQEILNGKVLFDFYDPEDIIHEIQGSIEEVAVAKAREAAKLLSKSVIVEDTALVFEAFGNQLPGPYIKQFVKALGVANICKMLDGFGQDSRNATAISTFAVCQWPSMKVSIFQGKTSGSIVHKSRGDNGFGWDSIFQPAGFDQTYTANDSASFIN